jgi:hypothetical protein
MQALVLLAPVWSVLGSLGFLLISRDMLRGYQPPDRRKLLPILLLTGLFIMISLWKVWEWMPVYSRFFGG